MTYSTPAEVQSDRDRFLADAIAGLSGTPKTLPCKYFYDARGSELFDQICDLPEYYPTRCELAIMDDHAARLLRRWAVRPAGRTLRVVELGSGSSVKTRELLDAAAALQIRPLTYVPVDISADHLRSTAAGLRRSYPEVRIDPIVADFTRPIDLPAGPFTNVVYFPGSTIGNFDAAAADTLLRQVRHLAGPGGGLILGVDLDKDPRRLEAAYDDAAGVTARFNRNLLHRLATELDSDVDPQSFEHRAVYNANLRRVEMHLVSPIEQTIRLGDRSFHLTAGESIHTESSHKYNLADLNNRVDAAGWDWVDAVTDPTGSFAVVVLQSRP